MDLLAELTEHRLLAIVRARSPERLVNVVSILVNSGIAMVELPLTTPDAIAAMKDCAAIPGLTLGAGTVLSPEDAQAAVAAGAHYLVTPAVLPEVLDEAARVKTPVLCGAFTPTEVLAAMRGGASVVKIFPASVGGPSYFTALRAPLVGVHLVAVGGIGLEHVKPYLNAGAVAVGVGSPLVGDAADAGSLDALAERAHAFVAAVSGS